MKFKHLDYLKKKKREEEELRLDWSRDYVKCKMAWPN